jgi:hypothetical protein
LNCFPNGFVPFHSIQTVRGGLTPSGYFLNLFVRAEASGVETAAMAPKGIPPNATGFGRSMITLIRFMHSFLSTIVDPAFRHPQVADAKTLDPITVRERKKRGIPGESSRLQQL